MSQTHPATGRAANEVGRHRGRSDAAAQALAAAKLGVQWAAGGVLWLLVGLGTGCVLWAAETPSPTPTRTSELIERYSTDLALLQRFEDVPASPQRTDRLRRFYGDELRQLEAVSFDALDQPGRIDYLLFLNELRFQQKELDHAEEKSKEIAGLVPFAATIRQLEEARRRQEFITGAAAAKALVQVQEDATKAQRALEQAPGTDQPAAAKAPSKVVGQRAAAFIEELRGTLRRWHDFYSGYDPDFSWWAEPGYQQADRALQDYVGVIRRRVLGVSAKVAQAARPAEAGRGRGGRSGGGGGRGADAARPADAPSSDSAAEAEEEPIIGDPIGRPALLDALAHEMIPYTPEELIDVANREFAWCEAEYRRAARDLGCGDDWHQALERVKNQYVPPGEQPKLIRDLAQGALAFVQEHDLVTVPELCRETWRMEMMSPERQKVNPFFTGGEVVSVSYPVASMSYEDKLMSLRGNNIHFSHATVLHELIPGHGLQLFMAARERPYRRVFRTPFLVEGWALYWEMLLWDLQFTKSPEDRIGALFWRSHRCARIIFSLRFHLGQMTAQEAIDFLVERVGHERRNATAEVRRSVASGEYGPLYQAAYMLGGLQLRALHHELVDGGKLTNRHFHDAVLGENAIPIEMIRASLTRQPLTRDYVPHWRFYPAN